jgi:hypothetical protein
MYNPIRLSDKTQMKWKRIDLWCLPELTFFGKQLKYCLNNQMLNGLSQFYKRVFEPTYMGKIHTLLMLVSRHIPARLKVSTQVAPF